MRSEQIKLIAHRTISAILFILSVVAVAICAVEEYYSIVTLLGLLSLLFLLCLINAFTFSFKRYDLDGHEVSVYCGAYHHYIDIDGERFDEHNTILSYTPIHMSCEFDGHYIEVTISTFNMVAMKVDNKLYKKLKRP